MVGSICHLIGTNFDLLNPIFDKFIHFPNFYQNLGLKGQKFIHFYQLVRENVKSITCELCSAVVMAARVGEAISLKLLVLVLLHGWVDVEWELKVTGGTLVTWGLLMGPHMVLLRLNSVSHICNDFFSAERG